MQRPSISKLKAAAGIFALSLLVLPAFAETAGTNIVGAVANTNAVAALTATTIPTAASLPDPSASLVRVFGALILVIAVFLGGVWLFRNWQRLATQKSGGAKLNLLEVKSLGQRQSLYVVGYQQQRMLLASSPAGITLVSHLPEADEAEAAAPAAAPKMNFAEAFQQVLNRK